MFFRGSNHPVILSIDPNFPYKLTYKNPVEYFVQHVLKLESFIQTQISQKGGPKRNCGSWGFAVSYRGQ